jgi:hypothetical protein
MCELRRVRRSWISALLLLGLPACSHAARPPTLDANAPPDVPVYREPMHRLVFQNSLVRVLDVRLLPGDTTAYHVHSDRMMGIAVQDARIWIQPKSAPPSPVQVPPPTPHLLDNWSQTLPYTHRVANVDTLPLHYVVAEWRAASGADGPALPDGPSRRLIKEGPTTWVYQITLMPGRATEPHTHAGVSSRAAE